MTDGMGLTLSAGDPVLDRTSEADIGVSATVLRVIDSGRCVVQLDPIDRTHFATGELGDLAFQSAQLDRMKHGSGEDFKMPWRFPRPSLSSWAKWSGQMTRTRRAAPRAEGTISRRKRCGPGFSRGGFRRKWHVGRARFAARVLIAVVATTGAGVVLALGGASRLAVVFDGPPPGARLRGGNAKPGSPPF